MSFLVAVLFSINFFLNLDVIQDSNVIDSFCIFLCVILDEIGNHRRFVWRIQDFFRLAGNEKCFCFFLVQ